jgi:hypothetical protein
VPRLKWNIWGNDGGATALAVIPYVKVPTASTGIGNPLVEGGALLTLGINLPYDFTAIVMTEFDDLRNGANSLTPNLQLDAATYIGLTRSSPALTVYSGLSQRF